MTITAKVIEDSVAPHGRRITTLQLCYPRFIHAEFMTHRVFSRNASSSRAVRNNPAMPIHWGRNQPGMQASGVLEGTELAMVQNLWKEAANRAADFAQAMAGFNLHKQVANRVLEPFQHMHVVMTATEFDNFFELRLHPDAQPEIHELARVMSEAMDASQPNAVDFNDWHLPYITDNERHSVPVADLLKMSTARCARVSYLKHDGGVATKEEDFALYERLVGSDPIHASPCEHQATPMEMSYDKCKNFIGWRQYRFDVEYDKWLKLWEGTP
jgi:hypothetical protein